MQRPRPGAGLGVKRSRTRQLRRRRIQPVNVDHVAAEVVDISETVIGRKRAEVRMRGLLPILVGAMRRVVLRPHCRADLAIRHQKACRASTAVVCREQHAARLIKRHMAGSLRRRILRRQLRSSPLCTIKLATSPVGLP